MLLGEVAEVVLGAESRPLHSTASPSASFTCLSALAASFLDNRSEPPLEDKLRSDFLEIRSDWDLSRLKELFGDDDADAGEPACEPAEPASPAGDRLWPSVSIDLGGEVGFCNDVSVNQFIKFF